MANPSSSLTCTKITLLAVLAVVIQIIGLSLFVLGFFPVKPTLSGVSGLESFYPPGSNSFEGQNATILSADQLKSLYQELSGVPPLFDRLILMVIDGLPAEFVLGKDGHSPPEAFKEAMPYTQSLLNQGRAVGYHAKAAPPTVTMPRLKAMVSGAIGGFLDVAFNFNTQALLDDNIIVQFLRVGWKMVMHGDETWLKLFPGMFARHDGVSSFFVKDTVQVDHNVSRHLGFELKQTDWSLLILHYLGLDHVGHIGGRKSVLMAPKLREMDETIKMIDQGIVQTQENDGGRTLLLVVSDHGMTESGNHGGSSYEETDSLALFIGPRNFGGFKVTHNKVNQVDIASSLALLFGVPIPKNNVGMLMGEVLKHLTGVTNDQHLRLLELNSWQLLRLLHAQLPDLVCEKFSCNASRDDDSVTSDLEEMFCCLYLEAASLHESWKSRRGSMSMDAENSSVIIAAYHNFLRAASEWLSRRATDKPVGLLASGVAAMLLSCVMFLGLLFFLCQEFFVGEKRSLRHVNTSLNSWFLDEMLILFIIIMLVISMGSSSMIEEEQYIWYFFTTSFYLVVLRKIMQSVTSRTVQNTNNTTESYKRRYIQISLIIVVLISGRILRGWHQGGVNWAHLPDIAKWLEQAGSTYIKLLQMVSVVLVISINLVSLLWVKWSKRKYAMAVSLIYSFPGLLVLLYVTKYQDLTFTVSSFEATLMAQIIYAVLIISAVGTTVFVPWLMPLKNHISLSSTFQNSLSMVVRDSSYMIGYIYIYCWCLLQLLLQQPINSVAFLLLFMQIFASIWLFSNSDHLFRQWVEVAALYFVGMAGHFGLGNTNTLATIDVAGAFIGVLNHSTLLSGILMFIITYASPILSVLSMVVYIAMKETMGIKNSQEECDFGHLLKTLIGFPCLVPLGLNSILLIAYTIVLLLMRNHLFVWSVFSPKYLYVCATTACVCFGVTIVASTIIYVSSVLALRVKMHGSCKPD
ncbi:PREDICTED: GPI ethanolamine phosphate transferase 2 [Ipomoea nil]|uniref:GPI ethanolamine phosphate transferase 2 n=1 Tax=Ipomoea nil TaxID=35883 RepID=UPI00090157A7|nr:PREDICTED: GPI ethanolamine phosphate transferase 2 [Ipomoea nil]